MSTESSYEATPEETRQSEAEARIAELIRRLNELERWVEELAGDIAGGFAGVA